MKLDKFFISSLISKRHQYSEDREKKIENLRKEMVVIGETNNGGEMLTIGEVRFFLIGFDPPLQKWAFFIVLIGFESTKLIKVRL